MAFGFMPGKRSGRHYELARKAALRLKNVNLLKKGSLEKHFEHVVVSYLEAFPGLRKHLITQVDEETVEKISQAKLFGFKHRPDCTIGNDGTAIEIKVITSAPSVREVLGQALAYRMRYRFVIPVFIDNTPSRQVVKLCSNKKSPEYALLQGLCDQLNIFSVVGPVPKKKNLAFLPKST